MVWRRLLLIIAIAVASIAVGTAAMACTNGDDATTGCINGGGVDVTATGGATGSTGGGGGSHSHNGSGGNHTGGGSGAGSGASGPPIIWKCLEATCPPVPGGGGTTGGTRPITLTDIATFRPTPGVQHMQPDGWTIPGLETNFYAVTGTRVVNGTLLGQSAAVRFTPVSFHWSYGDGKTATRSTKGGTWKSLHVAEFERTPTSHVYAHDGRFTIRLVIDFAAEYRFAGGPYYPISGVIPLRANDLHITVDGAKTVLVEHDCAANPSGPGC